MTRLELTACFNRLEAFLSSDANALAAELAMDNLLRRHFAAVVASELRTRGLLPRQIDEQPPTGEPFI